MSSHHDHDNHSNEAKPVAFRTPLILGLVTILIILLAVSTCDKKHGCCEDEEKCEASCESKHGEHGAIAAHGTEHAEEAHDAVVEEHTAVADTTVKADTAHVATPVKAEEQAHH
ncbi:MAG: hypothetical protein C0448_09315 [Sphingobacteriaceae bacterium]|nr:hypothetical protein [Sphingobacteriaceae bacterium]